MGNIPNQILTNIANTSNITTYGVSLPDAPTTCEPLLMSLFEVNNNDSRLTNLMQLAYQAQKAYGNATRTYVALSEGSSIYNGYVYEWVIAPNGNPWQVTNATGYYFDSPVNPIVFTKAAFGFLALYNDTYSKNLAIALEKALPTPTNGYYDGMDTNGALDAGNPGSDTNSLILDSALYYILQNPNG